MANEEHLARLQEGGAFWEWNDWRESNPVIVPDLRGADLTGVALTEAQLTRTDLRRAVLVGCQIYGISAWGVQLEEAIQTDL